MRILIITQYFFPEDFRFNDVAEELVKLGHKVEVVTGMPNYPKGEIFSGFENKFEEDFNGVSIHRTNTRPRHTGSLNLFLNYISFVIHAKKRIKKLDGDFDIVICYMPSPVFQLSPSIYAKNKFCCPLLLMCCDQWPESLKARGMKENIVFKIIAKYCKNVFSKCDYILNACPSFINYNHAVNGVPLEKMDWTIQHSLDAFQQAPVDNFGKSEGTNLIFAGNIGKVQNVRDIVLAYNELKYPNLKIHIFGDGSEANNCRQLVQTLGLDENIIFYGRVDAKKLNSYYPQMDACLLTLSGKSLIGNTIPSKLANYLSTGKAILAAINGDSRLIIDDAKCGLYTDPDDYLKLSQLINYFYINKGQYDNCGKNARDYYLEKCTLEAFMCKFTFIIDLLTKENTR